MKLIFFVFLPLMLLIEFLFSQCLYNQILNNDGTCTYCNLEGANYKYCLRCVKVDDYTECVECVAGYTPMISNGKIQSCAELCSVSSYLLTGFLLNKVGYDNCFLNNWSSTMYNVPAYDMFTQISKTTAEQALALKEFYTSMNGPMWKRNANWLVGDPCQNFWYGISCNLNGDIISIIFGENKLRGIFPTEIVNLNALEELTIYNEYDSHSEYTNRLYAIEKRINELISLKSLTLRNLNITDSLSTGLYSFLQLEILDLSFNNITGTLTNSITNLKTLKRLNLANNKISGSINSFNGFTGQLEIIEIQNNLFSSNLPTLDNIQKSLKILDFTNNDISGGVPTNYFDKTTFTEFIYMGLMLNPRLTPPDECVGHPYCFASLFINYRSASDIDFILTDEDKMYLHPIEFDSGT